MRIKKMTTNRKKLLVDVQILLSVPWKMYREQYGEYAYCYWTIKGSKANQPYLYGSLFLGHVSIQVGQLIESQGIYINIT